MLLQHISISLKRNSCALKCFVLTDLTFNIVELHLCKTLISASAHSPDFVLKEIQPLSTQRIFKIAHSKNFSLFKSTLCILLHFLVKTIYFWQVTCSVFDVLKSIVFHLRQSLIILRTPHKGTKYLTHTVRNASYAQNLSTFTRSTFCHFVAGHGILDGLSFVFMFFHKNQIVKISWFIDVVCALCPSVVLY